MITFGTWVMLCQGFLPAVTLASRNEGNVAPMNATKRFFLQAFKIVCAFELMREFSPCARGYLVRRNIGGSEARPTPDRRFD